MRIQHNIMAMNAYRNYNTNTSALSKNLEKLSSGYKINRAGDDAAGLAISEKMRAQITGLNAAQKNVKDGVSLVKTAEGAMQEIQDMLNRMDYLATQSANGTYDNDTDRANLQKEVEQLKTEINRIADSANFNGIKLLNGSLDANATGVGATQANAGTVTTLVSSTKGSTLGTSTILHSDGVEAAETEFGVDLHELKFSNNEGETFQLQIGNNTFTLAGGDHGTAGTALSAADIAAAFEAGEFKDAAGNAVTAASVSLTDGTNTGTFAMEADGNRLVFTQAEGETPVNGDMAVSVGIQGADAIEAGEITTAINSDAVTEDQAPGATDTAEYSFDLAGGEFAAGSYKVTIAGKEAIVELTQDELDASADNGATELAAKIAAAMTGIEDGLTAADPDNGVDASVYGAVAAGTKISFTASAQGNATAITGTIDIEAYGKAEGGVTGDYNVKTTVTKTGVEEAAGRIASGVATLTKDDFADGTIIKVGNKDYTVTTDAAKKDDADTVYVGDLDWTNATADLLTAIDRLSVAADSNEVWTVGQGPVAGTVTFVEKVNAAGESYTEQKLNGGTTLPDGAFDLTKEDVIKETFGIVTGKTTGDAGKAGSSLVLQIGDTSDAFNQMKVNIGSMKTTEMGLDFTMTTKDGVTVYNKGTQGPDAIAAGTKPSTQTIAEIDISTRDGASDAINTIKNAINYVSGVRGDLGALQNRLEHTGNNLSVMAENIQDAESTIRDTDVAEEMMAYTKNNILVQSAQAMLAQANQVPQGVLQLLG